MINTALKINTRDMESEGIAGSFFNEWQKVLSCAFKKESLFNKRLRNKGNIERYLKYNEGIFRNISIDYKVTESSRNPIIKFTYISPKLLKDKDLFGSENRAISFESCSIPVRQRNNYSSISAFKSSFYCPISKHAISRVLYRLGLKDLVFKKDYEVFFKQFKKVPVMSEFYLFIFFTLRKYKIMSAEDLKGITLIFPTKNGLFLGDLNYLPGSDRVHRNSFHAAIRTFVDDEIFKGSEQLEVKNNLEKIFSQSSKTLESPFLSPTATIANTDTLKNFYAHGIFYFSKVMEVKKDLLYLMSKKDKKFDQTIFYRLNNGFERLNKTFNLIKEDCGINNNASIDQIYKKINIKALNNQI